MNNLKKIFLAWVVVFCCSLTSLAQVNDPVCVQIENVVAAKVPTWKLERKSRSCHKMSYFKWTSGKSVVYVFIFPENSSMEATETFEYFAADEEFYGRMVEIIEIGLRNLGNENRVWKSVTGSTGVDLRKGKVVIRISASTTGLAKQFATYIADAIPDA